MTRERRCETCAETDTDCREGTPSVTGMCGGRGALPVRWAWWPLAIVMVLVYWHRSARAAV